MIRDDRLDRWVEEELCTQEHINESEFHKYDRVVEYADHTLFMSRVENVVEQLEKDPMTRRAIITSDRQTDCMVGIQVLYREKLHVVCWLRSSDRDEKRDDDIGFLIGFGEEVRRRFGVDDRLQIHVFTTSLHWEVEP